jgi:hypothetical protein
MTKATLSAPGPGAVEATLADMVVYRGEVAVMAMLVVIAPIPPIATMKAKALAAGAAKATLGL